MDRPNDPNNEIENLRNNILWLANQMPRALKVWASQKPNCVFFTGVLRNICEKPGTISKIVFDPVLKWLSDYQLLREGRLNLKQMNMSLDDFLKVGLRVISKFIIVAEFLSAHTDFLAPYPNKSQMKPDDYQKQLFAANKAQKEYSEFIDILSSKLIGCNKSMSFLFLDLSKTVRNLSPELQKLQNYLENQCTALKIKSVKRQ